MVNYLRAEVKAGNTKPEVSSREVFEDDRYLKPVLEDDALLFGLDEIMGGASDGETGIDGHENGVVIEGKNAGTLSRIAELEEDLQRLQSQFLEYRETVRKTLDDRWNEKDAMLPSSFNGVGPSGTRDEASKVPAKRDDDSHYFTSYSYNGMLKVLSWAIYPYSQPHDS